jgi:hypothetical protein
MRKEKMEEKVMQKVAKVVGKEVQRSESMWPPLCGGFVHQPKRPVERKEQ